MITENPFKQKTIQLFSNYGKKIIGPSPKINNAWDRQRAQVLSIILIAFVSTIVIIVLLDIHRLIIGPPIASVFIIDAFSLLLLFTAYGMSRTKHYWIGSVILVSFLNLIAYAIFTGLTPEIPPDLGYLVVALAILLSSILFSTPKKVTIVLLGEFLGMLMVVIFSLHDSFPLFFGKIAAMSIFIVLSIIYSILINRERQELTKTSLQFLAEKKKVESLKLEEERYHTMLGHFLKNDLQKIVTRLELLILDKKSEQSNSGNVVNDILDFALRSSKSIDAVNKIFTVLQSPFERQNKSYDLLGVIHETIAELESYLSCSYPIKINNETLDVKIFVDKYIKNLFFELLLFCFSPKQEIIIQGSQLSSQFYVIIRDNYSKSIPEDVSIRLKEKITESWEAQGLFLGISLVSVIMNHYGGSLNIQPGEDRGNEFQLIFPSHLIQSKKEIE